MPFFIEYLKQGGLFDEWVADCPRHVLPPGRAAPVFEFPARAGNLLRVGSGNPSRVIVSIDTAGKIIGDRRPLLYLIGADYAGGRTLPDRSRVLIRLPPSKVG